MFVIILARQNLNAEGKRRSPLISWPSACPITNASQWQACELEADLFEPKGWSPRRCVWVPTCLCVWVGHINRVSCVYVYAPILFVCLFVFACEQKWKLNPTASDFLSFLWPNWISPTLIFKHSDSPPPRCSREAPHINCTAVFDSFIKSVINAH